MLTQGYKRPAPLTQGGQLCGMIYSPKPSPISSYALFFFKYFSLNYIYPLIVSSPTRISSIMPWKLFNLLLQAHNWKIIPGKQFVPITELINSTSSIYICYTNQIPCRETWPYSFYPQCLVHGRLTTFPK